MSMLNFSFSALIVSIFENLGTVWDTSIEFAWPIPNGIGERCETSLTPTKPELIFNRRCVARMN